MTSFSVPHYIQVFGRRMSRRRDVSDHPRMQRVMRSALLPSSDVPSPDKQMEQNQDDQVVLPEPFVARDVVRLAVLSRLVEIFRFTIAKDIIDEPVSKASLTHAFGLHAEMKNSQLAVSEEELSSLWTLITDDERNPLDDITFGVLFDFEFPLFPETTAGERRILQELCDLSSTSTSASVTDSLADTQPTPLRNSSSSKPHMFEFVTKDDVCEALGVAGDAQVVEYIFASGVTVLPTEVFRYVVASLSLHPRTVQYAPEFVKNIATTKKRMQPLIPYVIVLVLICAMIPSLAPRTSSLINENMMHWIDNDWETGCSGEDDDGANITRPAEAGALRTRQCDFSFKSFFHMSTPYPDALRYLKRQWVLTLWHDTAIPPSRLPVGGVRLSGAAVIRYVRSRDPLTALDEAALAKCRKVGLRAWSEHFEVSSSYACDYVTAVEVPFDVNQSEALKITGNLSLRSFLGTHDGGSSESGPSHSAVIIQFVGFAVSSPTIVFNTDRKSVV